jgi:hypothetical protein
MRSAATASASSVCDTAIDTTTDAAEPKAHQRATRSIIGSESIVDWLKGKYPIVTPCQLSIEPRR